MLAIKSNRKSVIAFVSSIFALATTFLIPTLFILELNINEVFYQLLILMTFVLIVLSLGFAVLSIQEIKLKDGQGKPFAHVAIILSLLSLYLILMQNGFLQS